MKLYSKYHTDMSFLCEVTDMAFPHTNPHCSGCSSPEALQCSPVPRSVPYSVLCVLSPLTLPVCHVEAALGIFASPLQSLLSIPVLCSWFLRAVTGCSVSPGLILAVSLHRMFLENTKSRVWGWVEGPSRGNTNPTGLRADDVENIQRQAKYL